MSRNRVSKKEAEAIKMDIEETEARVEIVPIAD